MQITALTIISVSELAKVIPDITYKWIEDNRKEFDKILWSLGANINQPVEFQQDVQHRNRFDEIVTCDRYVANERTDKEWTNSGYATQAAIDKASGSKLMIDLYRIKGQVE